MAENDPFVTFQLERAQQKIAPENISRMSIVPVPNHITCIVKSQHSEASTFIPSKRPSRSHKKLEVTPYSRRGIAGGSSFNQNQKHVTYQARGSAGSTNTMESGSESPIVVDHSQTCAYPRRHEQNPSLHPHKRSQSQNRPISPSPELLRVHKMPQNHGSKNASLSSQYPEQNDEIQGTAGREAPPSQLDASTSNLEEKEQTCNIIAISNTGSSLAQTVPQERGSKGRMIGAEASPLGTRGRVYVLDVKELVALDLMTDPSVLG